MGNTHKGRNKRGGRHTRGTAPRAPSTAASESAGMSPPSAAEQISSSATPPTSASPASSALPAPNVPVPPRRVRSAPEPSMRTPYAPGQRASRGSRRSESANERQAAEPELKETEVTATYEEIVVVTQGAEPSDHIGAWQDPQPDGVPESNPPAAERDAAHAVPDSDWDAEQGRERPAHRHHGHPYDAARRNGHLRNHDLDHEHDHSYTPAHLRPALERDGTLGEPESGSRAEAGHDMPDTAPLPRGDVRGDVGPLIDDLRALFQRDRATASANGDTRCGICYLHFALDALEYRDDEGYYVCSPCAQALGAARMPMVRRQKRS